MSAPAHPSPAAPSAEQTAGPIATAPAGDDPLAELEDGRQGGCCSSTHAQRCCDLREKASCCGPAAAGRCGCQ